MIKKVKDSRFFPCQTIYPDGHCSGTATRNQWLYECNQCAATWNLLGEPLTPPKVARL